MKLGSLFDGSGGFPLAASMCGITPIIASEVEPYPVAVTTSRFPHMKHLGDISQIDGGKIEPVDIITFGSPCQDLSVAGKRAGMKHEDNGDSETTRSGLFMEAVRIIKEMRSATHGKYPKFAVWENVPGAFSSNKGEDFRVVLEELIKIVEPKAKVPPADKKGWAYADCYVGDGWSLAYRILDSQYIRTAQRRRRIYLVLDLRGESAGEILFKRESLRGDIEESGKARKGASGNAENGSGTDDRERKSAVAYSFDSLSSNSMRSRNPHSGCRQTEVAKCLDTTSPNPCKNQGGIAIVEPAVYEWHGQADRVTGPLTVSCTLNTRGEGHIVVTENPVYCLQGNGIDRADTAGCNGKGWKEDVSYTLNTIDRPAVAYATDAGFYNSLEDQSPPILARCYKDPHLVCYEETPQYIVRRLTPTECARLQGFPDTWGHPDRKEDFTDEEYLFWLEVRNTHATINGRTTKDYTKDQMLKWYNKLHTDSSEYKMWGNGIALPTALYVMQGIADVLQPQLSTKPPS